MMPVSERRRIALLPKIASGSNAINLSGATDAAEPDHDRGRTMGEAGLAVHADGGPRLRDRWGVVVDGSSHFHEINNNI